MQTGHRTWPRARSRHRIAVGPVYDPPLGCGGGVALAPIRPEKPCYAVAGSRFLVSFLSNAARIAAQRTKPASTRRLALKLPVCVRTKPTRNGPQKPPSVPKLLIKAKPPAAAVPARKSLGIAQNTPNMLQSPIVAKQSAIKESVDV